LSRYVIKTLKSNNYSQVRAINIDETSQRKGHDYITLFVDLDEKRTIFIDKGMETVKAFGDELVAHNSKPESITDVSCDMSPAFISGIKENLPDTKITFDRFHIMKTLNKSVDNARKQEAVTEHILKDHKYIF